MNLTDEQIKQALECCSGNFACDKCSMNFKATLKTNETCGHDLMKLALDLINRKNAKIERLQAKCENTQVGYNIAKAETEEYKAINKSLKADRPFLIANARAEAIKEFLDKLIDISVCKDNCDGTESLYVSIPKARQVLKEMVGDS